MNLTINSKKHGQFDFWMDDEGGYIYQELEGFSGTLGMQMCKGGGYIGSTLYATPETFERVCRNWYTSHVNQKYL